MAEKTLGDEIRDENEHQRWLVENGKLYDAAIERAERAEAERDELQCAIMRLPQPSREMGDGPDERVTHVLDRLERIESEFGSSVLAHSTTLIELDAARAEVERLRTVQSKFLAALDDWIDELYQHGVEIINVPSRATMLEARAALDAPAEKETTK